MPLKKTELYSSLWRSCDELRGGMDASQYKDYILTLLFVKYVSDKYAGKKNPILKIGKDSSFEHMISLKGNTDIGNKINIAINQLLEKNKLKGQISIPDFNDESKLGRGKEMQDRLSKLIGIFQNLDLGSNRVDGDDLLGDAYEYLMRHFATESGKSKGQFYTPSEVSQIIAKLLGISQNTKPNKTVYDPTCGSGSLLLKASDEARNGLSIYGQENDNATASLAKMNMILHNALSAELWKGNTLASPYFKEKDKLKRFDFVVANPPFSTKSWQSGFTPENDEYKRFTYGIPPAKNGDYAFLLHIIASLNSKGKGAVILPHGVLFRGNAEATIRQNIIRQGYIKSIIGLPANLFYGTSIPACIIVLDKENAASRTGIFMIDASEGYKKDGNKNRLRHQDIHQIVDTFINQREIPGYSRMVALTEISNSKNDFNLNLPRYIDKGDAEDMQDLTAHLSGGIPKKDIDQLKSYWKVFKQLRKTLINEKRDTNYVNIKIPQHEIQTTILKSNDYKKYLNQVESLLNIWQEQHESYLRAFKKNDKPKALIYYLAENLLQQFEQIPLLNKYDVYQKLMDYWQTTLQDDLYQIAASGWKEAVKIYPIIKKEKEKQTETPDLVIGSGKTAKKFKADMLPPDLIKHRFFSCESEIVEQYLNKAESLTQQLTDFLEEHGEEGGFLDDLKNEKGNITKQAIKSRLKNVKDDVEFADEYEVIQKYNQLAIEEAIAIKEYKKALDELNSKIVVQYGKLTKTEVQDMLIHDKWFVALHEQVIQEAESLVQYLVNRLCELYERYETPLPQIAVHVEEYSKKVNVHLRQMGLSW